MTDVQNQVGEADLNALRTLAAMPHPMAGVCGIAANEIERLRTAASAQPPDDLVSRLREVGQETGCSLDEQAADEIERLRAVIRVNATLWNPQATDEDIERVIGERREVSGRRTEVCDLEMAILEELHRSAATDLKEMRQKIRDFCVQLRRIAR